MAEHNDENLWETAQTWRALAIAAAVITPIACLFFLPWILQADGDDAMLRRVQMAGAAAAIGATLVTFCTVVWRGLISTQQARLQRLQIDKLSDQIAATERNNLASLLQKGAELIAEHEKPAKVAAGIASLRAVGEGADDKFAIQAMDILADYLVGREEEIFGNQTLAIAAINALALIWQQTGRLSNRVLNLSYEGLVEHFHLVVGVKEVAYREGDFFGVELVAPEVKGKTFVRFEQCTLEESAVDLRLGRFEQVAFRDCVVAGFNARGRRQHVHFHDCDFSKCEVQNAEVFPDLRQYGCYYLDKWPPIGAPEGFDWSAKLHVGKPATVDEEL
ncbi:hypothetical protein FJ987_09530 [Mesorhizobium sp. CU2]|uniref:hypothetical protein n=1 Tax=unclassified Mesorhizobium TaxID=325217 RepID=UPI001128F4F5|nr:MULTISPECIES: hypothetical protein [unclassified Mesorhizobium]TPN86396.1 hypothetical protein FJ988_06295 [Mesorhizobium sp. CU3]TPO17175.1 hypothetical protein FJ987_09530 [Mesorhizobium sp. CU2]